MTRQIKLSVIIPTYNEKENIEKLTKTVLKVCKNRVKILIIDDNSPDGTGKLADQLKKRYKNVDVVHRKGKLGMGTAHVTGMKQLLKEKSDLIMTMDADFSHDPKHIPDFVNKTNDYDVVVGSRYIKGGGVNWGLSRRIVSKGANLFAKTLLGLEPHDLTSAYRCYKREVLESIDLDSIKSEGFSFVGEILYMCKLKGFRIGETPIIFIERKKGKSKLSEREMRKFFMTIIKLRFSK